MINLLPNDVKQSIGYGRRNTLLFKWVLSSLVAIVGLIAVIGFGMLYMTNTTASYGSQISSQQEQLKAQKLEETQKEIEAISGNLKLSVDVLSREVLFSKLIQQIAAAIPSNAALSDLKINKLEGGIDLVAIASDYNTASQVQINLQDPNNKIFDKADILNISCLGTSNIDPRYPCTVSIRAQFAKDNPFLLINKGSSGVNQ